MINFKNTTFCYNTFTNADHCLLFAGENDESIVVDNVALGCNLLYISDLSYIDDQPHMGNQWDLPFHQGMVPYLTPQALCINPDFALFSEFNVHTPQSTDVSGSGFNPFHPKDLSPDNTVEWWFQSSGTPAENCLDDEIIDPSESDSKLQRSIADGTFSSIANNSSLTWQAERSLFLALSRNPSLENMHTSYATFKSALTDSNIDKLCQVFLAIDTIRNGNATTVSDAIANQEEIDDILIDIEEFDDAWQNATTFSEQETAKNSKAEKLAGLVEMLVTADDLRSTHLQQMQTDLDDVRELNVNISPNNDLEAYEKITNSLFMDLIQLGGLTEEQLKGLSDIANTCPKLGGMAVYFARGMYPSCLQSDFSDFVGECYDAPTSSSVTTVSRSNGDNNSFFTLDNFLIFPNPATEEITVALSKMEDGQIRFYNIFGQLVIDQPLKSSQTILQINNLANGIYYVDLLLNNNSRQIAKLVVSR